jgi:ATP-dependent Lhr-like helicase
MVEVARAGRSALLIAPTGGGKTLAGFLPSLIELAGTPTERLHTLYISPLKALAVDVMRNLETPIGEMGLAVRAETRTGDTPSAKRQRQRTRPPQLLMTTPESLALLLSLPDAAQLFGRLRRVVIDELHALAGTKRGDLLALGLARLTTLAPDLQRVGLSATVAWPDALDAYLAASGRADGSVARLVGAAGASPEIAIVDSGERLPWAGHMASHAAPEILAAIKAHGTTIVFVNTRAQAEIIFQELWRLNDETLPIALHHGSLAVEQRRKVEAASAAWSRPRRSISGSIGPPSTSLSRSARRKAPADCCSASAAPIIGSIGQAGRCSYPATGSSRSNAWRRARPRLPASSTATLRTSARSTCWRNMCWA